MATFEKF